MTWLVASFAVLGGTLLQSLLPAPPLFGQAKAPILLAVVLYYTLNRRFHVALAVAAAAGFLQDMLSPLPSGGSVAGFCLGVWLIHRWNKLFIGESAITAAALGAMAAALQVCVQYVGLRLHGDLLWPIWMAALKVAGTVVYALVCTPLVFLAVGWLDRSVGNVEVKASVG